MGDAMFVNGGVTSAQEARLALAGLLAVHGGTLLDIRTGVMHGVGSTALVTGTSATAPMTVAIAPHNWVTTRGSSNGPYLGALEASTTVTIGAAPGSGTRVDVVYVKQQDNTAGVPTPDGTAAPLYGVLAGTVGAGKPSLSSIVGAEELATVSVTAGATATNGAGVLITNTAKQVVARGAPIPVRSQTERDALTTFPGLEVKRLDIAGFPRERWISGTTWASDGDGGWTAVTPLNGATAAAGGLFYRVKNGVCYVNVAVSVANPWAANKVIGQLPAGARPDKQVNVGGIVGGGTLVGCSITTGGDMLAVSTVTGGSFFFSTSFPVA